MRTMEKGRNGDEPVRRVPNLALVVVVDRRTRVLVVWKTVLVHGRIQPRLRLKPSVLDVMSAREPVVAEEGRRRVLREHRRPGLYLGAIGRRGRVDAFL